WRPELYRYKSFTLSCIPCPWELSVVKHRARADIRVLMMIDFFCSLGLFINVKTTIMKRFYFFSLALIIFGQVAAQPDSGYVAKPIVIEDINKKMSKGTQPGFAINID